MKLQRRTTRLLLLASTALALGACTGQRSDRGADDTNAAGSASDTTSGTDTSTSGTSTGNDDSSMSGTSAGDSTAGSMATSPTPSSGMSGGSSKGKK